MKYLTVGVAIFGCLAMCLSAQSFSGPPGWTKIPFSNFVGSENKSVCEMPSPKNSVEDCVAVLIAWNSCIGDTLRSRLVCWGGGHADYSGNEIYALDLNTVAAGNCSRTIPCWIRLTNYSPPNTTTTCVETLSDGMPNSRHTYDALAYVPVQDVALMSSGSLNYCGNGSSATWSLAMSSIPTSCGTTNPSSSAPACSPAWAQVGSSGSHADTNQTTCYDSLNNQVLMMDSASIYGYSPATKTWSLKNSSAFFGDYLGTCVYDSYDELAVRIAGAYGSNPAAIRTWSTAPGSKYAMVNRGVDSSCTNVAVAYPYVAYDPIHRELVSVPATGSNTIYHVDTSNWTCWTETVGTTLGVDYPQDTYANVQTRGKHFMYFPELNIYVLWNNHASDVWYLWLRP
jgi:hypothetical protein